LLPFDISIAIFSFIICVFLQINTFFEFFSKSLLTFIEKSNIIGKLSARRQYQSFPKKVENFFKKL